MGIKSGFANKELLSALWLKQGIVPCTITAGNSANTYDASPQPAAGIDSWDGGALRFRNLLVVIDVASLTAGSIAVTLRDSGSAITTANGAASTALAATLASITAAGLYVAELRLTHVYPAGCDRIDTAALNEELRRYLSVRAALTGGDAVMSINLIFGNNFKSFPVQDATSLAVTWNDTTS